MLLYWAVFLLTFVSVKSDIVFHPQWSLWKREHSKSYNSIHEEAMRHDTWLVNKQYIETHNVQSHIHGFTLKMNHLGDLVSIQHTRILSDLLLVYYNRTMMNIVHRIHVIDQ